MKYFADKACLSPNYFGDLIKKETGKTAQEYIQCRIIELAKERILEGVQTVSQVAYELGFQYPQHFSRLFKKHVAAPRTNINKKTRRILDTGVSTSWEIKYSK